MVEEGDQFGDAGLVQFGYLEPGLASERRYAEAIGLLSLWPEGESLLHHAAAHGVGVVSWPGAYSRDALASCTRRCRLVRINSRFSGSSTWLVSALVAHELKHAADDRAGLVNH